MCVCVLIEMKFVLPRLMHEVGVLHLGFLDRTQRHWNSLEGKYCYIGALLAEIM